MAQRPQRPRYKIVVPPSPDGLAPTPRRAARRHAWVGPVWGIAGFVLGVAVWHSLGFWDFVGKTVLKGDEEERRLTRAEVPANQLPALRTTGTVHGPKQIVAGYSPAAAKALRTCSVATPSASGEETVITPCPGNTPIAVAGRLARKSDFGAAAEPEPKAWSFKLLLP
jgi:hypothetical protein